MEVERSKLGAIKPTPVKPGEFPDSEKENVAGVAQAHEIMPPSLYEKIMGRPFPTGLREVMKEYPVISENRGLQCSEPLKTSPDRLEHTSEVLPALEKIQVTGSDEGNSVAEEIRTKKETPIGEKITPSGIVRFLKSGKKTRTYKKVQKKEEVQVTTIVPSSQKPDMLTNTDGGSSGDESSCSYATAVRGSDPEPCFLNGNVRDFVDSVWDTSMNPEGCSGSKELEKSVLWSTMAVVEPPIPSRCNRRRVSKWGQHESIVIPKDAKDSVSTTKSTTITRGGSPGTSTVVTERVVRSTTRNMTVKAGTVAARIKYSLPRIIGLLETAHLNRTWVQAVCCSMVQSGIGPGTRAKWRESLINEAKVPQSDIGFLISTTEQTIFMWAGVPEDISTNSGDGVIPEGLLDAGREVMSGAERERAFVSITACCVGSPRFISAKVCPFCVYQELGGESFRNTHYHPRKSCSISDAKERFMAGIMTGQVSGWLDACAVLHNKEQHSLNGNIDRVDGNDGERSGLIKHLRQSFWDLPPIDSHEIYGPGVMLSDGEKYLSKLHYADTDGANTFYSNVGSMHQYLGKDFEVGRFLTEVSSGTDGSNLSPPPGAWDVDVVLEEGETYASRLSAASSNLQWVGVGYNPTHNHGALTLTEVGVKMVDAASHPDPTTPNILNPQRANVVSGYITGAPMFGFMGQQASVSRNDWRDLGIKVGLYDDCRHNEFIQPTGVEWAWASSTDEPLKYIIPLNKMGQWHYNATFISPQALEASLRDNTGTLSVGQGDTATKWSLEDGSTRIISLPDSSCPGDVGTAIWVLSHLTYPLAWIVDGYSIKKGLDGNIEKEAFVRTSSLVDLNDSAKNIIFVVPGQYRDRVALGGSSFPIGRTDRHGNVDPIHPPLIYDMDIPIENLLHSCMNSKESLRSAFSRYVECTFDGGLNWLEIDGIITSLVVRWPSRVEAYISEGDRVGRGAPEDILEEVYGLTVDDGGQNPVRIRDYGGRCAVTSLDCRVSGRRTARSNPHIIVGRWSNMASLLTGVGVCRYKTFDVEDRAMVAARVRSGLHDRSMRGPYLRKALECWKRDSGIRDEIAFPNDHPMVRQYWDRFVSPITDDDVGLNLLAKEFLTPTITYSWQANITGSISGSSLTGIRSSSSWWRNKLSTEWGGFCIGSTGRTTGAEYSKDDRPVSWSYGLWIQLGQGWVDVPLESVLMRLNIHTKDWGLTYKSHPNNTRIDGYPYLVETSRTGEIADSVGWKNHRGSFQRVKTWGWGVSSYVRDWDSSELKTLAVPTMATVTMESNEYTPDTWLSRGCVEGVAGPGLRRDYLGRELSWKKDAVEFRSVQSFAGHPEESKQEQSPDVPAQLRIEALLKEISVLQAAARDNERVLRNYNDQNAVASSTELKQHGTHSSGQSAVDPTIKAETLGKYSQVLSGKAVQLGDPEPVVAPVEIALEGKKQKEVRAP
ncbi:MAG: putative RdRp-complex [Corcyphos virus 2]|nr:MAG: putative RdRp-complex [Corcyphos virus 2]